MKKLRAGIIHLFEQGKTGYEISKEMKLAKSTVYKIINRFKETGSYEDKPRKGRPRTARTMSNKTKVKGRIQRNPSSRKNSIRKLRKAIGVSRESVRNIFKELGMKSRKMVAKTPLIFIQSGVKVKGENYREMLKSKVFPWANDHFGHRFWTFQQDGAPSHKAVDTQQLIEENCPDFISVDISPKQPIGEWPPNSPDLNVMDYSIWSILESKACAKPHQSIEALKKSLKKAWGEIPMEMIRKAMDDFPKRLVKCIKAEGGHSEGK
jgi:transposase